jgi:hypothetical protein
MAVVEGDQYRVAPGEADMGATVQTQALATGELSLLAYARHMAATAQSDAARRLFASFVEQEKRRMEANWRGTAPPCNGDSAPAERSEGTSASETGQPSRPATESPAQRGGAKLFVHSANPAAKQVCLAGDFNGWDPAALPMSRRGGMFVKRIHLAPGEHQYKFLVDGEWQTDPAAEMQVPNGLGSMNSVITV